MKLLKLDGYVSGYDYSTFIVTDPKRHDIIGTTVFSLVFLQHSHSWISDDDIYRPNLEEVLDSEELSPCADPDELKDTQSPPSVVHRRQIGILRCSYCLKKQTNEQFKCLHGV